MPPPARNVICAALQRHGADQDVQIQRAVAAEIAERAGVGAAPLAFELGDDLHAAELRAPGDGAAREHRPQRTEGVTPLRKHPATLETMWCTWA